MLKYYPIGNNTCTFASRRNTPNVPNYSQSIFLKNYSKAFSAFVTHTPFLQNKFCPISSYICPTTVLMNPNFCYIASMTINRLLLFIFPSKMHCTLPPTKGGKCGKFETHKSVEGSKVPKSAVIMYCLNAAGRG